MHERVQAAERLEARGERKVCSSSLVGVREGRQSRLQRPRVVVSNRYRKAGTTPTTPSPHGKPEKKVRGGL